MDLLKSSYPSNMPWNRTLSIRLKFRNVLIVVAFPFQLYLAFKPQQSQLDSSVLLTADNMSAASM
jgi:hypothetical protein